MAIPVDPSTIILPDTDPSITGYTDTTSRLPTQTANVYITNITENITYQTLSGGGQAAGSPGDVQINQNGQLASDGGLTYNPDNDSLNVSGVVRAGSIQTDNFLYANGAPRSFTANAGGLANTLQYNNSGALGGISQVTYNSGIGLLRIDSNSSLSIGGGNSGQALVTDGSGALSWATVGGGGSSNSIANGTSNVAIATAGGNVVTTVSGTSTLTVTATGANITGTGNITGNLSAGNASVGTGNVSAGNVNVTSGVFTSNISATGLSSLTTANVGDLTANANANFTGNINATGANVSLGAIGNLHITGGTNGQVLGTDGSGGLAFVSAVRNGNSFMSIAANSNVTINAAASSWVFRTDGILDLPANVQLAVDVDNLEVRRANNFNVEANTAVNIYTDASGNAYQWQFGDDGALTVPGSIVTPFNISIGNGAGTNQGNGAIAIGSSAAASNQGVGAIAIGGIAGENSQGVSAIALGYSAGGNNQSADSIAIGNSAGQTSLASGAVAIGSGAGFSNTSAQSLYIGANAGTNGGSFANVIVLNSTGAALNPQRANATYISSVRNDTGNTANAVYYNATTKEITYAPLAGGSSIANGTSNVSIPNQNSDIEFAVNGNTQVSVKNNSILQSAADRLRIYTSTAASYLDLNDASQSALTSNRSLQVVATDDLFLKSGVFSGPNIALQNGDITMSVQSGQQINILGIANIPNVANLRIAGGSNGQFLRTDGNGNLTWANAGGSSSIIANGTSNVSIPAVNGNIELNSGLAIATTAQGNISTVSAGTGSTIGFTINSGTFSVQAGYEITFNSLSNAIRLNGSETRINSTDVYLGAFGGTSTLRGTGNTRFTGDQFDAGGTFDVLHQTVRLGNANTTSLILNSTNVSISGNIISNVTLNTGVNPWSIAQSGGNAALVVDDNSIAITGNVTLPANITVNLGSNPQANTTATITNRLPITINGNTYYIMLTS